MANFKQPPALAAIVYYFRQGKAFIITM